MQYPTVSQNGPKVGGMNSKGYRFWVLHVSASEVLLLNDKYLLLKQSLFGMMRGRWLELRGQVNCSDSL